jgi:RNA polymerase sigma-70 factor (ECF subfamily)
MLRAGGPHFVRERAETRALSYMLRADENRGERDGADIVVLERLRSGDAGAVADLYDRYRCAALGLAVRIVRDVEEAEDVVHDAFTSVVERAHQYQPERGTVVAWLLTTVRNLAVDRIRRRTRRALIAESELLPETRALLDDRATNPEEDLATSRARVAVRAAMEALPAAQKNTLFVAFFEGLSYPEMAERDNVPLGTIKSRAARAIHALRAALTDEGWDISAELPSVVPANDPEGGASPAPVKIRKG